ncbi:MAG: 16S rRNA (cytosine(967)-C(5))-methyltransferase RsmB [Lachnospiraceae bacterium]|nr:16S rRNA (cytosine(967)-C(5))-methyltransferase RsmB [Lachnospiraceae bacterium]
MADTKGKALSKDKGINIRELALDILMEVSKNGEKSHVILKAVLDKYDYLPIQDKGFLRRLVSGTIEYRLRLDYVIDRFSKVKVNKLKPLIRELLRLSIYQLLYMDRVPDSAVCNEAVKLASKRGFKSLSGYVNGVLRAIARGRNDIKWPDENAGDDTIYALSIKYSCPEPIIKSLIDDYGYDTCVSCLEASLSDNRGVYVRIDESLSEDKISEIKSKILSEPETVEELPYAVRTLHPDKVTSSGEFADGLITIQDISSMSVCEMAELEDYKGKKINILDMCAAPGGKTLHAVSKMKRYGIDGEIKSLDVSELKVDLIKENIRRMHCEEYVKCGVWDATVYDETCKEKYDIVLADIPCSGLGVIARKPDIKYNITDEGLESLEALQRQIIDNAAKYVKPGGRLILSTCTMRKKENEDNVARLVDTGGFKLQKSRQLFLSDTHDGFFTAVLNKE